MRTISPCATNPKLNWGESQITGAGMYRTTREVPISHLKNPPKTGKSLPQNKELLQPISMEI